MVNEMQIRERTAAALAEELGLKVVLNADPERTVTCGYAGDLLSWVMGKAMADNVWITIMSNVNNVAVATLVDVACILLAEGVALSDDVLETAKSKGVNVLSTALPAYEAAKKISAFV